MGLSLALSELTMRSVDFPWRKIYHIVSYDVDSHIKDTHPMDSHEMRDPMLIDM